MTTAQLRAASAVAPPSGEHHLNRDEAARALGLMVGGRALVAGLAELRRGAKLPPRPDAAHREGIEVGAGFALEPRDRLLAPARYLTAHLARGLPATRLVAIARGDSDLARKVPRGVPSASIGASATVPDLIPIAVGAALGALMLGRDGAVLAPCDRDSLVASYPALRLAAERRLPFVLVLDDRDDRQRIAAGDSVAGFGVETAPAVDVEAIFGAVQRALARARGGDGPVIVACIDTEVQEGRRHRRFRPLDRRLATDPIALFVARLSAHGFSRAEIRRIRAGAEESAAGAIAGDVGATAPDADPLLDPSAGVLEVRAT